MQTEFVKEHDQGTFHNSSGQLFSIPSAPRWCARGSQYAEGESFGQLRHSSMEHYSGRNQLAATKQEKQGTEQGAEPGNTAQFAIFPGKDSGEGQKAHQLQEAIPMHSNLQPGYQASIELGLGQPMICTKYPSIDNSYGALSTYGPQIRGRIMLPLNLTDGPIYVNAKQYHGIIRRRQSRAKAELANKVSRARKPYMHESRHLHALRRPRGCGGRFLNTKKLNRGTGNNETKKSGNEKISQTNGAQNSVVLQYENGNLNLSKEANGWRSNLSGSEVSSKRLYSMEGIDCFSFSFNPLRPSVNSIADMIKNEHSIVMPGKWVSATDHCYNLNV
ncbi:nuclear transcription factor Y subunit A-10-like [Malania oleifera]|uniref:nuclear transcription factor Y subunit A-10-like n=1 Tax=Malania oleifera TaxID=397392 RepID=UPI0025AE502C|nr:nuclear transcription factor Y subunit A-10-like [Malania oleifera]